MCGIAGFTHINRLINKNIIRNATSALAHRGPDQHGVYESADISLGAVRLKVIDLVSGDQPMVSDDGYTVIAFNGEIYNHAEIRAELAACGQRFGSSSDTEVVLRAFREWDVDCFSRLRGMFAIAIWTPFEKRLVLARDRVGIKPLYFHRTGSDVYFASEIKALLQHPAVNRRIDLEGLNCFLSLNYVPGPHTLIDGIRKLPPGHFLEWSPRGTRVETYWRPPIQTHRCSLETATEQLDSLLRQSVREHLVADVPLGVWISGGLDSSTILHYAAQAGAAPLKTFSVTFRGRSCDESPYISEISKHYGTEHFEFDLNDHIDLPFAIEKLVYHSDEPCADAGALPIWFLAQMSRRHVTVALSGDGADELFGGYQTYLADRYSRWSRRAPEGVLKAGLALLRYWPPSDEKISFEYKAKRFLAGSLMPPEYAHVFWNGTFTEREKAGFFSEASQWPLQRILDRSASSPGAWLDRFLSFDFQYYLPDDILCKVDRMSMAHAVEVRPPFLDHRICEFALSLPEQFKVRGSRLKFILRKLMKDKLPASILKRPKTGFDIPTHEWFRGVLKPLLLDTLTERAVAQTGLFRWKGVNAVLDEHLNRRANWGWHLWGLMTLLLWMKQWNIQHAPTTLDKDAVRQPVGVPTPNLIVLLFASATFLG